MAGKRTEFSGKDFERIWVLAAAKNADNNRGLSQALAEAIVEYSSVLTNLVGSETTSPNGFRFNPPGLVSLSRQDDYKTLLRDDGEKGWTAILQDAPFDEKG